MKDWSEGQVPVMAATEAVPHLVPGSLEREEGSLVLGFAGEEAEEPKWGSRQGPGPAACLC